jgi:hypothetical protein
MWVMKSVWEGLLEVTALPCELASFNHAFSIQERWSIQETPSFLLFSRKEAQRSRSRHQKHVIARFKTKACGAGSNFQQFNAYAAQRHVNFNRAFIDAQCPIHPAPPCHLYRSPAQPEEPT